MAHETPLNDDPQTDLPDPEDEPIDAAPAPSLNRAERRAQAKGKSAGNASRSGLPSQGNTARGGSGGTGSTVPVRFPRTGHK